MRTNLVLRSLVSGVCVYFLAAACDASEHLGSGGDGDGGRGVLDALADAIGTVLDEAGNPVHDANAAPLPPDVATEKCDKKRSNGGTELWVAEHSYPGQSATDLVSVQAMIPTAIQGYTHGVSPVLVGDGIAGVSCGLASGPQPGYTVTFVRQR